MNELKPKAAKAAVKKNVKVQVDVKGGKITSAQVRKATSGMKDQSKVKKQRDPLYTLTHREIDKNSKTVAYHIETRKGARYRVEKDVMVQLVATGAVKDVTLRGAGVDIQVVGIGTSVGLYPKVLNLTELPVRAVGLKKAQEEQEAAPVKIEKKKPGRPAKGVNKAPKAVKRADKGITLEIEVKGEKVAKSTPEVESVF